MSLLSPSKQSPATATKDNTKILAKYPLDYPGLREDEVDRERALLGWKKRKEDQSDDPFMLEDVFGEKYWPRDYSEESCNGISVLYLH